MQYANTHLRLSVQVFRDNCLVASGLGNRLTSEIPYNVWSSTKSVVSLLTGIAESRGDLALGDRIGTYLPAGLGDRAHRAITIRQLLTETSGLDEAIISEAATLGTDVSIVREALAQPIERKPGTHFRYSQRTPDLLAYVVQRAVGMDIQKFAQKRLFGPLGILRRDYFWLRDRSGQTYGYANLFITPTQYAKLGLLMQNGGTWRGRQIVPRAYLLKASRPTRTNGCYGLLFWTNRAKPCTGASLPRASTINSRMVASAPRDLFAMVGAFQQNNFVVPSLGLTVSWTGLLGDTTVTNLPGLSSAHPASSDLYHNFFRLLMRAFEDVDVRDPGPLRAPVDLTIEPFAFVDPAVLIRDLIPTGDCNIVLCEGGVPTRGVQQNLAAILGTLTP